MTEMQQLFCFVSVSCSLHHSKSCFSKMAALIETLDYCNVMKSDLMKLWKSLNRMKALGAFTLLEDLASCSNLFTCAPSPRIQQTAPVCLSAFHILGIV